MAMLARMLAGPMLWAALFSAVYALHGLGCARGWPAVATPIGPLHPALIVAVWLVGLALHGMLLALFPAGPAREQRLPRLGAWTGLVASVVTLSPVVLVSSC